MLADIQPARPFIKWAGGKGAILAQIVPHIPAWRGTYHEPFIGGGALFYALAPARAVLSDVNADLITTYTAIRDHAEQVISRLHAHAERHNEDHYKIVRSQCPDDPAEIAARFIYLNRTCFNGLYRVNRAGAFNVPMGRYARPRICDPDGIHRASMVLQGHEIICSPFEQVIQRAHAGDLVYFDPPYIPVSPTSDFTSYTAGGFTYADQVRLRDCAEQLREQGAHVLISNSDIPITRDLYQRFRLVPIAAPRAINSRASGRGVVREILAIG